MKRENVLYLTTQILSALLITLVALSVQASESIPLDLTETETAWLSEHRTIRMGVDPDYPPFEFIDKEGRYSGMAADYLALIGERLGVEFNVIPGLTWSQVVEGGKNRILDLVPVMTPTDERREFFNFTNPYLFYPQVIVTRRDEAPVTDLADLVGKTMAVSKGYSEVKELKQRFPGINQLLVNNPLEELKAIATGQADAAQGNLAVASYLMQKYNLLNLKVAAPSDIEGGALALGVRSDWPELVPILNKALASITLKEHQTIRSTWGMPTVEVSSPKIQLTAEEKGWLVDHPVLRLGYDIDWPPVEYADKQGRYQGITTEYMELIAESLGVTIEPAVPQSWQATIEAAKSGQLDILSAVARTPQRDEYLNFTTPYLSFPMVIVTDGDFSYISDLKMLADKKVAVIEGYASHDFLLNKYPEFELFPVEDISKGLQSVRKGDADAFIDSLASVTHVMGREGLPGLKISGEAPFNFDIRIGIRKDQPILAGIMQKALDFIPEKKRTEIFNRWVSVTYERGFDYTLLWQILVIVFVVLAALAYWNHHLKKMVESRTQDLQDSEERMSSVLASTAIGIYAIDIQGICLFCNPSASQTLGYSSPDELIGKDMHALIHHHNADGTALPLTECPIHLTIINEKPQGASDQIFWRADGSFFPVEFSSTPLYRKGQAIGATVSFLDITDRIHAEESLRRSHKMDAIGQLAGGIAHDFNNLLAILLGNLELLQRKITDTDDKVNERFANMKKAGYRAT
jgi:two-component system sensor histidine kinase/response regulator